MNDYKQIKEDAMYFFLNNNIKINNIDEIEIISIEKNPLDEVIKVELKYKKYKCKKKGNSWSLIKNI